jgi:hypothetical protein
MAPADEDAILLNLRIYWALVAATFPEAWNLEPRRSRLTHGVSIRAMRYLVDHLTDGIPAHKLPRHNIGELLSRLRSECAWTEGNWTFSAEDRRRWNGLQNTQADIRLPSSLQIQTTR